ncbi:hypothetical protein ACOZB2_31310 [Pantoea endophytica]|uniref:Uncharacterized protein n=1 Tax=Pantoea sp. BJ2 TaxID=3141322 RepID=A0AAU7U3A7_9GAMM
MSNIGCMTGVKTAISSCLNNFAQAIRHSFTRTLNTIRREAMPEPIPGFSYTKSTHSLNDLLKSVSEAPNEKFTPLKE